jgi:hypothetical protein
MRIEIDHAIVVVDDLASAADRFLSIYGLASIPGGRHPGHGTGNRIVPLGDSYLELMAVVDPGEAAISPLGRWAGHAAVRGDGIAAICLRTDSIADVGRHLGEEPMAMARDTPTGARLAWRLVGLSAMLQHGHPFFIQWDTPGHPGSDVAPHRVDVSGIVSVRLGPVPPVIHTLLEPIDEIELDGSGLAARIGIGGGAVEI